ncbi:MAG: hypothetical protein HFJ72_07955 [Adlercreutzia sp.]|nr:hypothetical protein [Adlercreutzia sp.]
MREDSLSLSRRSFVAVGACAGVASLGLLAGCSGNETAAAPVQEEEPTPAPEEPEASEPAANEGLAATGSDELVYIVDRLTSKPGGGKELYDGYMNTIKPMIEAGGWTFVRATVSPAIWLDTDSNVIEIEWTMPDIAVAAWGSTGFTRSVPEYVEWWTWAHKEAEEISRVYSASETYMEVLNNV